MTFFEIAILLVAGLLGGVVNAIAGGGTFFSFGALVLAGVPPIGANATSALVQLPGYVAATLAYRDDIRRMWPTVVVLSALSALGALVGALVLLSLDSRSFTAMVPWLILAATVLFAVGPWLRPAAASDRPAGSGRPSFTGSLVQFLSSIYGGFFGAGMGVLMLATLGLTEADSYHRLNALKNILSIVIASVAICIFVAGGVVAWLQAAVLVPGVVLGGYSGVWVARRIPERVMRFTVIAIGILLSAYYFAGP